MIAQAAAWLLGVIAALGYPGLAAAVALESAGLPVPGEAALLAASYLAATGRLSLPLVVCAAASGAVAGDSLGYLFGRLGGRTLLERYGPRVGITRHKLAEVDERFARRGARTVFLARFVTLLRVLAGPLAGAARMPYGRFLAANAAGAASWAATMGALGFYFGETVASVGWWALAAYAAYLIVGLVLRRLRGARDPDLRPSRADEPDDEPRMARRRTPAATRQADGPRRRRGSAFGAALEAAGVAGRGGGVEP